MSFSENYFILPVLNKLNRPALGYGGRFVKMARFSDQIGMPWNILWDAYKAPIKVMRPLQFATPHRLIVERVSHV